MSFGALTVYGPESILNKYIFQMYSKTSNLMLICEALTDEEFVSIISSTHANVHIQYKSMFYKHMMYSSTI